MTGVGGVFPNYEDNLLDKKKISECFLGNFHEVLYPLNYTSKNGPWQYHSPQDNKHFIDLNTLTDIYPPKCWQHIFNTNICIC